MRYGALCCSQLHCGIHIRIRRYNGDVLLAPKELPFCALFSVQARPKGMGDCAETYVTGGSFLLQI